MIGFLIGLVLFIITIPLRSAILILKGSMRTTELIAFNRFRNRQKKEGKESDALDSTLNRKKNTTQSMTPAELALYTAQKIALRGLKTLLTIIQWVGRLITFISVLILLVMILFVACIVACVGAIVGFILGGGISSGGVANTVTNNVDCISMADEYLEACQRVWTDWRDKGYDYSQELGRTDPDYGAFRTDCSGYVYATLQEVGLLPKPSETAPFNTYGMDSTLMSLGKFEKLAYTSQEDLQPGDIVVKAEAHTQVYAGDGKWFNNGREGHIPDHEGAYETVWNHSGGTVYRWIKSECPDENAENLSGIDVWLDVILRTQKAIASKNPIYFSYSKGQTDWIDCTPEVGTWIRPDCSGIIYGMCQVLGVFEKSPDGPGDCFYTGDMVQRMIDTGKFEDVTDQVPTEGDLQPGDVVVGPSHTQIYMGDGKWVNGGNTEDLRKPDPDYSSFFPSGRHVVRYKG